MLEVIALVASTFLLMCASKQECCKAFYKIVSFACIALSLGALGCTAFHAYRYAKSGLLEMHEPGMMKMGLEMGAIKKEEGPKNPLDKGSESGPAEKHGCTP